jgi:hypothetical protein
VPASSGDGKWGPEVDLRKDLKIVKSGGWAEINNNLNEGVLNRENTGLQPNNVC